MANNTTRTIGFYRPHLRVQLDCGTELITKQSHKDECDIHNILRQYQRTGIIQHINSQSPLFTDLPSNIDYQDAMNTLIQAQETFAALPSSVRDSFKNDPGVFLAAFTDPAQHDKLRELGLLRPKAQPASQDGAVGSSQASPVGD